MRASRLLFVSISEMSDAIPVAVQHPILLDAVSKEAIEEAGEPMSPLPFRGFRLHSIWTQQPGGELAHQITFPHFLGKSSSSLLKYKSEKIPHGLRQGQKRVLSLKPLSPDHWNIASDLVFSLILNESRQRRKAKQAAQGLEGRSEGRRCLQQRHIPLGSLLNRRWEVVVQHFHQRPLPIGSESWRLRMRYLHMSTPSTSRLCMRWVACRSWTRL